MSDVIFSDGLGAPEGPIILNDLSVLIVEMALERGCVTHISADGKDKRMVVKTGAPNGQTIDGLGNIWITETLNPAIVRASMDGSMEVILTEDGEKPLLANFPWGEKWCPGIGNWISMDGSIVSMLKH
jgi:gluconolactonase